MFLGKDGTVSPWWRNFLYVKGASQSMKTLYSHVTQARNVMGGVQFATANGASPFSRESIKNFRILKQEVAKGGDDVLQAKYEEFLNLGIILNWLSDISLWTLLRFLIIKKDKAIQIKILILLKSKFFTKFNIVAMENKRKAIKP